MDTSPVGWKGKCQLAHSIRLWNLQRQPGDDFPVPHRAGIAHVIGRFVFLGFCCGWSGHYSRLTKYRFNLLSLWGWNVACCQPRCAVCYARRFYKGCGEPQQRTRIGKITPKTKKEPAFKSVWTSECRLLFGSKLLGFRFSIYYLLHWWLPLFCTVNNITENEAAPFPAKYEFLFFCRTMGRSANSPCYFFSHFFENVRYFHFPGK